MKEVGNVIFLSWDEKYTSVPYIHSLFIIFSVSYCSFIYNWEKGESLDWAVKLNFFCFVVSMK